MKPELPPEARELLDELVLNLSTMYFKTESILYFLLLVKEANSTLFDDVVELRVRISALMASIDTNGTIGENEVYQFEEIDFLMGIISAKAKAEHQYCIKRS